MAAIYCYLINVHAFRPKLVERHNCEVIFGCGITFHFYKLFLQIIRKNVLSSAKGIPCNLPNWKFCVIQIWKITLEFLFQLLEMRFNFQLKLTFKIYYFFPPGLRQSWKMRLRFPFELGAATTPTSL